MRTDLFRGIGKGQLLFKRVTIDSDGAGGDQVSTTGEIEGDRSPGKAVRLNSEIKFELPSSKGQLRGEEIRDAEIGESFGFTNSD